jgi:hypothetical protein
MGSFRAEAAVAGHRRPGSHKDTAQHYCSSPLWMPSFVCITESLGVLYARLPTTPFPAVWERSLTTGALAGAVLLSSCTVPSFTDVRRHVSTVEMVTWAGKRFGKS